jgi:iron complex transport system ATP-binding protein
MTELLRCENLVLGYQAAKVNKANAAGIVAPFSFELKAGEVVALLGENGCGKSTFLKTLCARLQPVSGTVSLCGRPLNSAMGSAWNARERAKLVTLVRMSGISCDRMTVREFVSLGRMPYAGLFDGRSEEDERIVGEAIVLLELENFANRWVNELSDGERSRVYLAQAVAQQVKVLLLDEPNAFLDIPRSRKLFTLLRKLANERDMGILVSTHSVEYAEKYCDRMVVIVDKQVRVAKTENARAEGLLDWTED